MWTDLRAQIEVSGGPSDFYREWESVKAGEKVVYVFARHFFTDDRGGMVTENCFFVRGPSFSEPFQCNGFNGPRESRPLRRVKAP